MADYPLGGLVQTDTDFGSVALFGVEFQTEVYTPSASDALDPAGLILGRITTTNKLVPYVKGGSLGAEVPVAILAAAVQADVTPSDVNIRVIRSGQVRLDKISTLAVDTIDGVERDKLQQVGILARLVTVIDKFDNS